MSYATTFHLLDGPGLTQSGGIDRYFKQTLATSVAFHVLVFIVLVSIRVTPIHERPLASYQIELVDLSEPQVSPSLPQPSEKKATPVTPAVSPPVEPPPPVTQEVAPPVETSPPVAPPVSPPVESPPPVPVPQERLAETFSSALEEIKVPESRNIPPVPPKTPLTSEPSASVTSPVKDQPLNMQAPPGVPELAPRDRPSVIQKPHTPSLSKSASLAKSLQQAVEAVPVPPTKHKSNQVVSAEAKAASPKRSRKMKALSASKGITLPPDAPKLAAATPLEKIPDRPSARVKKKSLSEALQQAVKSVVIPDMKAGKIAKKSPSRAAPPRQFAQRAPVMPKMVRPPQAPKLATVDPSVSRSTQATRKRVPQTKRDELGSRIAKLAFPEVDVSQPHERLSGTTANQVKTKTQLKVSGSSPDGNPYWGRVWAKIDQEWVAPPVNVHQGHLLQVILEFRLERTGGVKNLTIQQTSGNGYYDLAAKRAVLAAAPLPGFPPDMTERHFLLQFQFTVNEQ